MGKCSLSRWPEFESANKFVLVFFWKHLKHWYCIFVCMKINLNILNYSYVTDRSTHAWYNNVQVFWEFVWSINKVACLFANRRPQSRSFFLGNVKLAKEILPFQSLFNLSVKAGDKPHIVRRWRLLWVPLLLISWQPERPGSIPSSQ